MGSLVPPPTSDHFTSELCLFLSALSTTRGTEFDSLASQLVRLREALLEEAARETDESENDTSEEDRETVEETLSDSSTEKDTEEENSDCLVQENTRPTNESGYTRPTNESGYTRPTNESGYTRPTNGSSFTMTDNGSFVSSNNHRVMLSLQRGARWELEKRLVTQAFSHFGKVVRARLYEKPVSGAWGFLEFRTTQSAAEALNQVVRAGNCWLHTTLPHSCLTQLPVPHQILLESRYLPQVWEKEIVLRSFFSKFGVVSGVTMLGFGQLKMQRFIISFKDSSVAQELIGTTVKILTCTVLVKEVSTSTVGERGGRFDGTGASGGRRMDGTDVSGGGDVRGERRILVD
eukprot:GFUD01080694.1.p1 GENE.GFUD01080694.1~~GFUD01080694.1.p1  ORF type:complete len:348 (+),score=97.20 GFUD01080694.1:38-1081(+)